MAKRVKGQMSTYKKHKLVWDALLDHLNSNDTFGAITYVPFYLKNVTLTFDKHLYKNNNLVYVQNVSELKQMKIYQLEKMSTEVPHKLTTVNLKYPIEIDAPICVEASKNSVTAETKEFDGFVPIDWIINHTRLKGYVIDSNQNKVYVNVFGESIIKAVITVGKLVLDIPVMTSYIVSKQKNFIYHFQWKERIIETIDQLLSVVKPGYQLVEEKIYFPQLKVTVKLNFNKQEKTWSAITCGSLFSPRICSLAELPETLFLKDIVEQLYNASNNLFVENGRLISWLKEEA